MLQQVTLTGADDSVTFGDLEALSQKYPFVEWGILYHREKEGEPRYPSMDWIHELIWAWDSQPIRLALHICDIETMRAFAEGEMVLGRVSRRLADIFPRVQLNFGDKTSEAFMVEPGFTQMLQLRYGHQIITQFTQRTLPRPGFREPNHQVLFDNSRGKGVPIESFPEPFPGKYCGYAGGIGAHNVTEVLLRLKQDQPGRGYWIDMESSLRVTTAGSADVFNIAACRQVLELAMPFTAHALPGHV